MAGRRINDPTQARNPQYPAKHPSRLDQFAEDNFGIDTKTLANVTSKKTKK